MKKIILVIIVLTFYFEISFSRNVKIISEKPVKTVVHDVKLVRFLGNNIVTPGIPSNFTYYWNQVTPGNAGKWGEVAEVQDTAHWRWTNLDTIYNFSVRNGFPFKDHNLIWGRQQPHWIDSLDSANQVRMVETWIRQCGERYPMSALVDVVNEPLHNPPPYKNALGGDGSTGWDWVIWSFEKARKYFPASTKLLLNEFDILKNTANTHRYIEIINLLKVRNLIDGIGCQAHFLETTDTAEIIANLNLLEATGIPIYISEYDVNLESDSAQLEVYKRQFPVFWKYSSIKGVTLWGYIQGEVWQPYTYLIRSDSTERPALVWLRNFTSVINIGVTEIPVKFQISQNFPNPFNPSTKITFSIPKAGLVNLKVFDISGREVANLVNEFKNAGQYRITFDGNSLSSGVYFYTLSSQDFTQTKKMILLK